MKWYQKTWAIVLLLIIFFPAGAFLMWKEKKDWRSPVKILISVVFGFWFLIFATAALYDTSTETSTPNTKTESKSAEEAPKEEAQKEEVKEEETQKEEVKEEEKSEVADRWNEDGTFNLEAERNTTAAVDEIIGKAKKDANEYDFSRFDDIFNIIKGGAVNPWKDNQTMEQLMYFGSVIEYNKYAHDDEKKVGRKACEVAKYVYRGAETEEEAKSAQGLLLKYIRQLNEK